MDDTQRMLTERDLVSRFRNWLDSLDQDQLAALAANWENIMDDAALDRVDSWVIADKAIAKLREPEGPAAVPGGNEETGHGHGIR